MNIEVTDNDEVMRGGDGAGNERRELIKKGGERMEIRRWWPVDIKKVKRHLWSLRVIAEYSKEERE